MDKKDKIIMKYLKTFESFTTNETMDMMFMPVDPIAGAGDLYSDFYKEMKSKVVKFIDNMKNEGKETKEAFNLIVQASKDEVELSKEQRQKVYDQIKDVFKTIGLTLISLLPGDIIIFLLIKFFKAEKYVFPSSFL
jgi:hypothetical protein